MKLCFLALSLLFVSVYSIPIPSVSSAPTLSGKRVERYVDDIAKTLTLEHDKALQSVALQNSTVLVKKKRLDSLTIQFKSLALRLNNITNTYNGLNRERLDASRDYNRFLNNFKRIEALISKGKIDYHQEMNFLMEIKKYINKMALRCPLISLQK